MWDGLLRIIEIQVLGLLLLSCCMEMVFDAFSEVQK
jgi:hypothetical protein